MIYTEKGPVKHEVVHSVFRTIESYKGIIPTENGDVYREATYEQFKFKYQLDENRQRVHENDPMEVLIMDRFPDETISARKFVARRFEYNNSMNSLDTEDNFAPFFEIKNYFERLKKEFTLSSDNPEM